MTLIPFEYAVRNLGRSPRRLAATLVGATFVVALILAAAAFVRGMERSLAVSSGSDNVLILGAGSEESLERSEIPASVGGLTAASVPGIRTRLGVAYVSPEVQMALLVRPSRESHIEEQVLLRGVTSAALLVHPQVQIVEGRAPQTGRDEVLVGGLTHTRMGVNVGDLAVGGSIWFADRAWTIVGRFVAPGTVMDAEIWFPLSVLMAATKRTTLSTVVVTLDSGEFADVDAFCKQRLDLEIVAIREADYYSRLLDFFAPIRAMVWVTAGLIGLGGLLGGLNTMYAAFVSRIRELATLQTLGFSRLAIVLSLVQESVLATSVGALAAAAIGLVLLDGVGVRFSMGAFALRVDAAALCVALGAGLLLGAIGALPPAWRCLTPPVKDALRMA